MQVRQYWLTNPASANLPAEVQNHLAVCPSCQAHKSQLTKLDVDLDRLGRIQLYRVTSGFADRVMAAVIKPIIIPTQTFGRHWNLVFAAAASFLLMFIASYMSQGDASSLVKGIFSDSMREAFTKFDVAGNNLRNISSILKW